MSDQHRKLEAGVDYSNWPSMKVMRARQLWSELGAAIDVWRVSLGAETRPEFSPDRRRVTLVANIPHQPRTDEWSLLYADVVHNYRSALDALAWEMAHLDGAAPAPDVEKRIYFPFARTEVAWEKLRTTTLASVPGFVLDRLAAVQPYHQGPAESAIGVILHELDIADKHRGLLQMELIAAAGAPFTVTFRVDGDDDANDRTTSEWVAPVGPVVDGAPIFVLESEAPFVHARITDLPFRFMVDTERGHEDAFELLQMMEMQVRASFVAVNDGTQSREWQQITRPMDGTVG